MDTILPSSGTYKVNAKINGTPLDEFSFVSFGDSIQPFFEYSVSKDPDITALMVYLKDSRGETAGYKVTYLLDAKNGLEQNFAPGPDPELEEEEETEEQPEEILADITDGENEKPDAQAKTEPEPKEDIVTASLKEQLLTIDQYKVGNEYIIPVKNLDNPLPLFPIPHDLPLGRYTMVSQVLGGNAVLNKTEKLFYYLSDAKFSFEGIQVHLPGVASGSGQLIPMGSVIMLETKLDFDSRLEPYIVWYNNKRVTGEGLYSSPDSILLWKAPDQSGFFSLQAEAFPLISRQDLLGFQRGVSLLVSSRKIELNLIPEDTPNLLHWYTFEADLLDSTMKTSAERALRPAGRNQFQWIPFNGTYGLAAGPGDVFSMPGVKFSGDEDKNWQLALRFKTLSEGGILLVRFTENIALTLKNEESKLVLTLASPELEPLSEAFALPEEEMFVSAVINFSVHEEGVSASFNYIESFESQAEADTKPLNLKTDLLREKPDTSNTFTVSLGIPNSAANASRTAQVPVYTAIWDEAALLDVPFREESENTDDVEEEPLESVEQPASDESSGLSA
jgi:hypothetical protein